MTPGTDSKDPMNNNRSLVALKATTPSGIDKIRLFTQDFKISDTRHLEIIPNRKRQGELEIEKHGLFSCKGEQVHGEKAFHNSTGVNATIGSHGLIIQYNPSKIKGELISDPKEVKAISADIEKDLCSKGIETSFSHCKVSRIDIAKDRQMEDKVFAYQSVWNLIRGKRMGSTVQYPSGYRMGSKYRQSIFYDKGLESNPEGGNTNNMRAEVRLMNSRTIQRIATFSSLEDVYQMDNRYLGTVYNKFLNENVFRAIDGDPFQYAIDYTNQVNELKAIRVVKPRGGFQQWIMMQGIIGRLEQIGGMAHLHSFLLDAGYNRNTAYRMVRDAEKLIFRKASVPDDSQERIVAMFNEVKLKFCA